MTNAKKRRVFSERPELVQRYFRMAGRRSALRWGRAFARFQVRLRLRVTERQRKKALRLALEKIAAEAARSRRHGFRSNEVVLNLGLFFLIAERDIQASKIDALTHPDAWARSLAARVILLTIHELDLDKVAGQRLKLALDEAVVPEDLRRRVSEALRVVRRAQAGAQRQFAHWRNSTIAHRDPDAIQQYRDIVNIDELEVMRTVIDFYAGVKVFMDVLPLLVQYLGSGPSLLGQLRARETSGL